MAGIFESKRQARARKQGPKFQGTKSQGKEQAPWDLGPWALVPYSTQGIARRWPGLITELVSPL